MSQNNIHQKIHALADEIFEDIALAYLGNIAEARALSYALLAHHLQCKPVELFLQPDLSKLSYEALRRDIHLLKEGVPYQYVIGYIDFLGVRIHVQPGVFIPRPETEELVALIYDEIETFDIGIDIGTGTGCIALLLKRGFPASTVYGLDKNPLAIELANKNASELNLTVNFMEADFFEWNPDPYIPKDKALLVVSNPPYVLPSESEIMTKQVLDHEPHDAIFVPENDPVLYYRAILEKFKNFPAVFYFEINPLTLPQLINTVNKFSFTYKTYKDFNEKIRFLKVENNTYSVNR